MLRMWNLRRLSVFFIGAFSASIFLQMGNLAIAEENTVDYNINVAQSLNITLSSNNLAIDLNPNNHDSGATDLIVSAATNNLYGCRIFMSADGTDLTRKTSSTDTLSGAIPTLLDDNNGEGYTIENFPTNYWGWKLNSNIATQSTFYPFSTEELISYSTNATNENTATISFASKIDYSIPTGSYANDFSFIALANPALSTVIINNSNTTSSVSSIDIDYGGSGDVKITPKSGAYYLSNASCTNGYTVDAHIDDAYSSVAQTVTIHDNAGALDLGSTCTFTASTASDSSTIVTMGGRSWQGYNKGVFYGVLQSFTNNGRWSCPFVISPNTNLAKYKFTGPGGGTASYKLSVSRNGLTWYLVGRDFCLQNTPTIQYNGSGLVYNANGATYNATMFNNMLDWLGV